MLRGELFPRKKTNRRGSFCGLKLGPQDVENGSVQFAIEPNQLAVPPWITIDERSGPLNREKRLQKFVADALQLPLAEVPTTASSETLEAWDSLRHLDIILSVESAANIKFATAEIVELTSLEKWQAAVVARGLKQ